MRLRDRFRFLCVLPHVQVARQVTRIAVLRVQRAIQRGDVDAAILDVETVLRLARDLQPRGVMISQMVPAAITQVVGYSMIATILSSPKLHSKHCDSLLKVVVAHDKMSTDGYAEGLRGQYITVRTTLRDVVLHQQDFASRLKLKPGESVVKAILKVVNGGGDIGAIVPDDVDSQLARTAPAELGAASVTSIAISARF